MRTAARTVLVAALLTCSAAACGTASPRAAAEAPGDGRCPGPSDPRETASPLTYPSPRPSSDVPEAVPTGTSGPEAEAFYAAQEDLMNLRQFTEGLPGIQESGYLLSEDHPSSRSVVLFWKGSSPLQQQVVDEGARRHITVTVRQRRHSREDQQAATSTVGAALESGALQGLRWSTFGGISDYDGFSIRVAGTAQDCGAEVSPPIRSADDLRTRIAAITGFDVADVTVSENSGSYDTDGQIPGVGQGG